MSRSLKFARMLAAELRASSVTPERPRVYRVRGRLDIGARYVNVEVQVDWLFKHVKRSAPRIWCDEPWIKPGVDWHNLGDRGLCWVLHEEWRDAMSWKGKPVHSIMREGTEWFFMNTRILINRHYDAHLEGLAAWKPEWEAWGHGDLGREQYARENRLRNQKGRRRARQPAVV